MRCLQRDGGTSHIAPPDMNSYIKKYGFISTVTCEFLHMNSYVSDPCFVYKKMATNGEGGGGGGVTATIPNAILVPGSNSQNLDTFFLANLANFYVAANLAISTYIKPNI